MQIKIRSLHLAAYIKAHGAELLGVEDGQFVFESSRTTSSWRLEHANSCCRVVDLQLLELRKLLK